MTPDTPLRAGDALTLTSPLPGFPPPVWSTIPFLLGVTAALFFLGAAIVSAVAIRHYLRRPPAAASLALAALERDASPAGITRALRDYLARRVPALRPGLTTVELERLAPATLAPEWYVLLRECDDAKFAGTAPAPGLADRARSLVAAAETRFTETAGRN